VQGARSGGEVEGEDGGASPVEGESPVPPTGMWAWFARRVPEHPRLALVVVIVGGVLVLAWVVAFAWAGLTYRGVGPWAALVWMLLLAAMALGWYFLDRGRSDRRFERSAAAADESAAFVASLTESAPGVVPPEVGESEAGAALPSGAAEDGRAARRMLLETDRSYLNGGLGFGVVVLVILVLAVALQPAGVQAVALRLLIAALSIVVDISIARMVVQRFRPVGLVLRHDGRLEWQPSFRAPRVQPLTDLEVVTGPHDSFLRGAFVLSLRFSDGTRWHVACVAPRGRFVLARRELEALQV